MHHQPRMRVGHCLAHRDQQAQQRIGAGALGTALLVDRHPVEELHHQVGLTLRRGAAIQQARNVRVGQAGQDLAFAREVFQRRSARQPAQQLDRRSLLEVPVTAARGVHRAHAAFADLALQHPRAQARAGVQLVACQGAEQSGHRRDELGGGARGRQHRAHPRDHLRAGVTGRERALAGGRIEVGDRIEKRAHARIKLGIHPATSLAPKTS